MTHWPSTYFDGQWIETSQPAGFPLVNRGLLFGDGVFETIRVFGGKVPFWKWHRERLDRGCAFLDLQLPDSFTEYIERDILTELAHHAQNARIRITVFRKGQGKYTPPGHDAHYLVQWTPLDHDAWLLPDAGLHLGRFFDQATPSYPLCQHKTLSALPYVLASQFRAKSPYEEVLLANHQGAIVEASSSNLFCFWRGCWYTPPVEAGCLAGTTRAVVIESMQALGWPLKIETPTESMWMEADHLWLTNSIQGIRWASTLEEQHYTIGPLQELYSWINQTHF
ncbi:MAG: aminotransferase class IV [Bacteroidota bacterium]